MARPQGLNTKAIGEQLISNLNANQKKYGGINVFYDHGNSSKPEVCQPTTYMGRRYGRDATLSGVDIVVTKDKKVILAIEIEESTVPPKKVIGDVFGIIIADRIRIKGKPYPIKNTTIIIAIADDSKGKRPAKYIRLERLLNPYFKDIFSKPLKKVRIITCPTSDLVRRIERLIRLETGKCI
ncbi:MAG: hypothetical protein STSR0008_22600 [Ignavibacterium sp.]